MAFNLHDLINSRLAANLGLTVLGIIPPRIGAFLANLAANHVLSRPGQPMAQAVRQNQWVVHDMKPDKEELDRIVRATFRNRALAIYDLFHYLRKPEAMRQMIEFGSDFEPLIERNLSRQEGTLVLPTHTGALELVGIAAGLRGMQGFGLTFPDQTGGYQWHDEIREQFGIKAVPTTMSTLKQATEYLKDGGTVITGLERPLPESKYKPIFFGRPTSLPLHYVTMAVRANVPVVVAAIRRKSDGGYFIIRSEFIQIERFKERREELICNAERILSYAEEFIRAAPEQWAMFYPLWPEVADEVP
jgi:KDO2-lipid IV(A) lauroyltransferase